MTQAAPMAATAHARRDTAHDTAHDTFASDVYAGLTRTPQKSLPSRYLYDTMGSALFELITDLPEYGLTRADERLIQTHANDMFDMIGPVDEIVELGSGTGRKTRWLLEAAARRGPCVYRPIDISGSALAQCERDLSGIGSVQIASLQRDYLQGLAEVCRHRAADAERPLLVLFLGSTIGNFGQSDAVRFLSDMRGLLQPDDLLLLGTDLVKPVSQLLHAYNDALGITGAFNLNVLQRINRELGGDFDLRRFEHEVRFNAPAQAIEMHLRSREGQVVRVPGAGLTITLDEGETIWTEISHKYQPDDVPRLAALAGFDLWRQWIDPQWPFAETLLVAT